jgi:SAM-dependent methyltransferase
MDIFDWIKQELNPIDCTSDRFIYDDMESQSFRCLPVIYQPFDPANRSHWADRGSLFDFLDSIGGEGQKLLDFGPGDGWPALIVAPFAGHVTGVDGARRRVEVCAANARRLGIENAVFLHNPPGSRLPFEDHSFDGVMAASSIEQTPDPKETLRELHRVLRPGGRLRVHYEALGGYRNGQEREVWLWGLDEGRCRLILYDRHIDKELVWQVGLTYALPEKALLGQLLKPLSEEGRSLAFGDLTVERLEALRPSLLEARALATRHPSGRTFAAWMREIGFRQVEPSHAGADFAARWFERLPADRRPADLQAVDELLRYAVQAVIRLPAPLETDPMITAVK